MAVSLEVNGINDDYDINQTLELSLDRLSNENQVLETIKNNSLYSTKDVSFKNNANILASNTPAYDSANKSHQIAETVYADNNFTTVFYPVYSHTITSFKIDGSQVVIEDSSVWKIAPNQKSTILSWETSNNNLSPVNIYITQNTNWFFYSDYKYKIVNADTGAFVYANLYLGPLLDNQDANIVVGIDQYRGIVELNNGTVWKVDSFDLGTFRKWLLKDHIIIGKNSSWFTDKEMILINVETNSYVRANII